MINALTLFLLVLLLFSYCIHNNKMKCKRSNRRLLGTLFLAIPRISGFSASSAGDRVSTSLQVVNDKFVKQIEEDVARRERRREAIEQELLAIERKKEAARQRIQDLQAGLEADIVKLDKQASKLDSDLDTALQDIQTQLEKLSEAEAGEIGGEWWRLATQAAPPLGAATSVLAAIVAGRKVLENREDVWEQQRQEAEALKVRKALEQQQQPGEEMEQQKANMETKLKKEGGGNFISIGALAGTSLAAFVGYNALVDQLTIGDSATSNYVTLLEKVLEKQYEPPPFVLLPNLEGRPDMDVGKGKGGDSNALNTNQNRRVESKTDKERALADPVEAEKGVEQEGEEARIKAKEAEQGNKLRVEKEKEEEARVRAQEDTDIMAAEEARLKAEDKLRLKQEEEAKIKAEDDASVRQAEETRQKAEEEARIIQAGEEAKVKAEVESMLKAPEKATLQAKDEINGEQKVMVKTDEDTLTKAEKEAKTNDEAKGKAEEEVKLKSEDIIAESERRLELDEAVEAPDEKNILKNLLKIETRAIEKMDIKANKQEKTLATSNGEQEARENKARLKAENKMEAEQEAREEKSRLVAEADAKKEEEEEEEEEDKTTLKREEKTKAKAEEEARLQPQAKDAEENVEASKMAEEIDSVQENAASQKKPEGMVRIQTEKNTIEKDALITQDKEEKPQNNKVKPLSAMLLDTVQKSKPMLDLMKKESFIAGTLTKSKLPLSSEFPLPKVNMPSIEVPKFETPKLDFPSSFLPKMEMKLDLMKKDKSITDSSEFPLPKVNMPSIEVPKFETPKLDFPSSFLPKMEMKMFEAPNLNLPLDNSEEAQLPKLPMNLPEMYKSKLPKPISDELEKSFPGGLPPAFLLGTAAVATTGVAGVAAAIVNMQKKETDDFLFQPDANSNEGSKKGIPKINSKENMLSEAKMKEKRLRAEQEETRARPLAKQTAAQEKEMKASDKQSEDVFGRARTTTEEPATNKSRISAEVASSFGNSNSLSKDGASSKNNTQSKDTESSKVAFLSSSFKTTNSPLKSASPFGSKPTPKEGPSSKKGACQSSDSTDGNMAKSQQKKTMFPFGTTPKGASSFSSKVSPKEVATSTAESSKAAFSSSSIAASSKEASPSTDNTDKNIAKTPTKKTILPFGTTPKGASPFNGKVSPKEVAASTAESSKAAFSSSSIAASSKEASPSTDSTDKNIAKAPAKKTIFPFGTTPKGTSPFSGKMSPKEAAASTAESSNPAFSSSSSKNRNSAKAPAKKSIISSGTTPKAPLSLSGIALPKIAATSTTEPSKVAFSSSSSATSSSNEASPSSERKDGNIARAPFKTTKNPLKGASIFGNKQSPNEISSSKNVNAESQTQAKKKIDTFGTTKSTSSSPFSSTTSAPKSASPFGGIASPKEVAASTTKSSKVAFPFSTSAASSKGVLPSSQSKDRRIAKTPAKKTMLPFGTTPKGASPFSGKVSPKEVAASTTESPINEDLSPPESNDAEISKSVAKKTISPFGIKRASVSTVAVNTTSTSDNTGKGLSPPASKSVTRDEGERDRFAAMRIESLASTRVTESVAAARAASAASGKEPEEKSLSPPETTPPVFPSKNNMAEEAERVRLAAKRISESVAAARAESEAVQKASSETEPAEKSTTPFETTPTSALATPVNPSSSNSSIPDGLSKFASLAPSKPPPASNSDITEEAEAERLAAKKITESVAAARAAAEAAQKAASSEEGVNMKTEEDPIVKPTSPETNAQKTAADEEVASERERLAAKQICESVAAARAAAEAAQKAASSEEGVHMKTEEDPSVKLTSPETNVQKTAVDEEVASDIAEEAETERLAAKKIAESVAAARAAAEAAQKAASSEEGVKMKTKEDPCVKPTAPKTNTQKAAADEEVAKETIEKAENKSSNTETAAYEEAKKRVEKEIEEIAARAAEKKKDDAIEKAAFSRDIESEAKKESFPFESSKSQNEVNGSSEPARKEEVSSKGFTPKEFSHSPVNPNSTFPSDSTKVADVTICDSPAKNTFSPFGSASSEPPPPSLESSPSPKRNDVSSSPSFKPKGTSSFDDNGSSGSPAKKAFSFKKTSTPFRSDPLGSSSPVSKSSEKKEFSPKAFSPFGSDPPSSSRLPFKPKSGSPFENSASPKEVNGSNGTADQKSAKKKELLPKPFTPFGSGPPGFSDTPFKPIDGSPFENSKPPKETKESVASSEKQAFTPFGKPQPSDSSSPFTPNVSARFAALNKTKSFSSTEEGSKNVNETEPMEDTPKETRSKQ